MPLFKARSKAPTVSELRAARRRMRHACNRGDWTLAQRLVKQYGGRVASVRGIGRFDATPLHAAAAAGSAELLDELLEHGAHIDTPAIHGYTPLYMAIRREQFESVELLLEYGADADFTCSGCTPLIKAVETGCLEIVELLLEHEANLHQANGAGDEALHAAARGGFRDIAETLIEHGANVQATGWREKTPAEVANDTGHDELAQFLGEKEREQMADLMKLGRWWSGREERLGTGPDKFQSLPGCVENVAMKLANYCCIDLSPSEHRRFHRRVERNARRHNVTAIALLSNTCPIDQLARMLVTDSNGVCRNDGLLWSTVEFIRTARFNGVLPH